MINPTPADGQPIPEGLVAAANETVIAFQGAVTYALAAVIFSETQVARREFQALTAPALRS